MSEKETYQATQQARRQLVEHPETAGRHDDALRRALGAEYYQELHHGEHPTKKQAERDE